MTSTTKIKITCIIVLALIALFVITSPTHAQAHEPIATIDNDDLFRPCYTYAVTSICIDGELYVCQRNFDLSLELVDYGSISNYDFWLDDGVYLIKFDDTLYIEWVYDIALDEIYY